MERIVCLILLVAAFSGCASLPPHDFGPIHSVDRDLHGNERMRALGPFVETQKGEDGKRFAGVRPLFTKTDDPPRNRSIYDIVWPLGMVKSREGELDWRFILSFGHGFEPQDPIARHRWAVFPLLYGGEDAHGKKYFAFFPLGGKLNEFLMQDRITFGLFPLYAYSEHQDNKTHSVLWPLISRTKGGDVSRFRFLPFYGYSNNKDRWTKQFIMWPFWSSVKYHYPGEEGDGFVLFPICGKVDVGDRHSRMLIPPFFKYEWAPEHRALNCPWPIIQYRRGDIDRFYVWPLAGKEAMGNERQWFFLWPLFSGKRIDRSDHVARRFRLAPLVHYESKTDKDVDLEASDAVSSRYFKLWPLMSYRREKDASRFRMLAISPLKQVPGIERSWAPIWSLFTRERVGSATETELLWGMYRRRRAASDRRMSIFPVLQTASSTAAGDTQRSWSILYGLVGYKREGLHKQFRLLYFLKFGKLQQGEPSGDPQGGVSDDVPPVMEQP
ncbi:MAG: hypothetical protein HN341_10260 [Verrucomicrobia bacterium]|jgi:hypothetical protein|nr:hypothetical protein [Verrucomicrobiota bacterium]